uniref:Uncharacterized protein n=1 Tax=Tetraselmis sp. GSL018 TaxID=582737 RepID=A0A061RVZ0_9CHLO
MTKAELRVLKFLHLQNIGHRLHKNRANERCRGRWRPA